MSDRQRHRAFAFSALFIVAVCVVVWLVERPPSKDGAAPAPTTGRGRPLVLGAEAGEPSAGGKPRQATHEAAATPPPSSPSRRAEEAVPGEGPIVATARRFTVAFVRYEVGQLPVEVRRTIQSTATPSFASSLLAAPPSIPNGVRPPPPPRVRLVALANGPEAGQAEVAVELAVGGAENSTLTELLSRLGHEWRISGLG